MSSVGNRLGAEIEDTPNPYKEIRDAAVGEAIQEKQESLRVILNTTVSLLLLLESRVRGGDFLPEITKRLNEMCRDRYDSPPFDSDTLIRVLDSGNYDPRLITTLVQILQESRKDDELNQTQPPHVYFVGLPGAGKSTILRHLRPLLKLPTYIESEDLDQRPPLTQARRYSPCSPARIHPFGELLMEQMRENSGNDSLIQLNDGAIIQRLISYLAYIGLDPRDEIERQLLKYSYKILLEAMPIDTHIVIVESEDWKLRMIERARERKKPEELSARLKPLAYADIIQAHLELLRREFPNRVSVITNDGPVKEAVDKARATIDAILQT